MVSIGRVWDRTTEVLRGRTGMLASLAALSIFAPSVLRDAAVAFSPGSTVLINVVGLAVLVATVWGQLALLAVATDPATDRDEASRQATRRLLPALGLVLLLALIFVLLLMPMVIALLQAGVDFSTGAVDPSSIPSGVAGFITIYFIAVVILAFWAGARLIVLNPVILNERRGLGAIRRSIRLTHGMTWRIIGVMALFLVLVLVVAGAAQAIVGLLFRLILGPEALPTVTFLARIVGTAVTTAFTVVAAAFTAQLYVAARSETAEG